MSGRLRSASRKIPRAGFAALVFVSASGLLVHPAASEVEAGGFVAVASAQAARVSYGDEGFLIVKSLFDSGGPVSQAVLNPIDGESFASLPYPGETPLSGPGLIAANGGPTLPAYPFFVSASTTNPEQKFADPGNVYSIAAKVSDGVATGDARVGAGNTDTIATGQRTLATAGMKADAVTATAQTTVEGISLGAGALRIGSVRSRSVTTYAFGTKPETATELVIEGGRAGGMTFSYGPQGLTVASGGIPVPAGQGLETINKTLAPSGLTLRFVGDAEVPGGRSAAALEVAQAGALPTGGQGHGRIQFGAASTGITIGGGASALTPPVPPAPVESAAPDSGPGPGSIAGQAGDAPGSRPAANSNESGSVETAHVGAGSYTASSSGSAVGTITGSEEPQSNVSNARVAGAAPSMSEAASATPAYRLRTSASVGVGYAILVIAAVLYFVVASVWRRGSFTL